MLGLLLIVLCSGLSAIVIKKLLLLLLLYLSVKVAIHGSMALHGAGLARVSVILVSMCCHVLFI